MSSRDIVTVDVTIGLGGAPEWFDIDVHQETLEDRVSRRVARLYRDNEDGEPEVSFSYSSDDWSTVEAFIEGWEKVAGHEFLLSDILPDSAPVVAQPEEPAQVATYPLTSETMYGKTPNGGTTICNTCGVPVGYNGLVPPVLCLRCSQTESTAKGEKLAENLKHLDKPGLRETPRRSWARDTTSAGVPQGRFWEKKVYLGHNKNGVVTPVGELGYSNIPYRDLGEKSNFLFVLDCQKSLEGGGLGFYATSGFLFDECLYQRYMFHRCSDDNGAQGASDIDGNKQHRRKARNGSARLSRSALLRWFPVALENTVFHPAVACHYLQYFIANTRHYSNLTRYVASTCRDNKAQVNLNFACKTY